jgi:hypothetical protein
LIFSGREWRETPRFGKRQQPAAFRNGKSVNILCGLNPNAQPAWRCPAVECIRKTENPLPSHSSLATQALRNYSDKALRFAFAHALLAGTSFIVSDPQGHLPSFFDMAMQGQDFVPAHAQT